METIFERLRMDHDRHREVLDALRATHGDTSERRALFAELRHEHEAHAAAEERALYARLLGHASTRDKSAHSIEEHETARSGLEELMEMGMSNPNWIRRFEEVAHEIEHHMKEEEHGVFQLAGKVLDEEQKTAMAEEFESAKQEELAR